MVWGYTLLTAAQLGFAGVVVIGKYTNTEVPAFAYIAFRFFVCAALLAVFNGIRGTSLRNKEVVPERLTRRDWMLTLPLGCGIGSYPVKGFRKPRRLCLRFQSRIQCKNWKASWIRSIGWRFREWE